MKRYLGIILILCLFWLTGCVPHTIEGNCVPRAFFNAMAWGIEERCPVLICDFEGHFQAVGKYDGEFHYLRGAHWQVWPGDKEGHKPKVRLYDLRGAMEHYLKHNPWACVSEEELEKLNKRVRDMLRRVK